MLDIHFVIFVLYQPIQISPPPAPNVSCQQFQEFLFQSSLTGQSRALLTVGPSLAPQCMALNCSTNVRPPAFGYEFHHNGKLLYTGGSNIYNITNVIMEDGGLYKCVPSNAVGRGEEARIAITVTGEVKHEDLKISTKLVYPFFHRQNSKPRTRTIWTKPVYIAFSGLKAQHEFKKSSPDFNRTKRKWGDREGHSQSTPCDMSIPLMLFTDWLSNEGCFPRPSHQG